jgi:hypothetical protein
MQSQRLRLSIILLGAVLLFSVPSVSASQTNFFLSFSPDDLSFDKMNGFDKVTLQECSHQAAPGEPLLPVKYVQIAIPSDAEVISVQISHVDRLQLPGSYSIYPAQELRPLTEYPWKEQDFQFNPPDPNIYSLSAEFPGKVVEILNHGFLAGQHIVGLAVYPLQYVPSEGRLILLTQIEFSLLLGPAKTQPVSFSVRTEKQARFYQRMIEGEVLNPQDVSFESQTGSKQDVVEYLIITDTNLVSTFQQLADWKTQKGIPAEIVTRQWIYSDYSGDDQQEQIRNCVRDFYQNHGTIWILLGGDTDILPHRITWVFTYSGGWADDIPSDLYFSDLDGSWDADGDGTYGEFDDNLDLYPEVFVGRAPVSSLSQAQTFVNKTLAYEIDPPTDYQTRMLLAGEFLWPTTDGGVLKNYIYDNFVIPLFPDVTRLYESLGNLDKTSFRNALNSGQMITNHCGHANYNVLSIGSYGWYNSDMDDLTNGARQGIFYTYGCISAAIDFDCIGERWVKNPDGGGIAYFGNSRYGWGDSDPLQGPGSEFDKEFFRKLFFSLSYHAGKTLADSKLPFIGAAQNPSGWGRYIRWTLLQLLLIGDPELPIYTQTPQILTVSYPDSIDLGQQTISIYVEDGGSPVSGALVCISKDTEIYEYEQTATDGWVSFDIETFTPGAIAITVTHQNAVPHLGEIPISSTGPYAPLPFDLISPAGGDTIWTGQPTLFWEKAEDIDTGDVITYDLHYSYFDMAKGLVQDSVTDLSDTIYTLSELNDNQLYFWKVKAKDSYELYRWSNQESSFRVYVPDPPLGFNLTSPSDQDTVWESTCDFLWQESQDPDPGDILTYSLYFSTDSLFGQKDSILGIVDTNYIESGLLDDQDYFWKVKAKDRFDLSAWSVETFRFHTYYPEPPLSFSLIYPPDSASICNQDTLTLAWETASDPDPNDVVRYTLEYSTSEVFNPDSTVLIDSLTENSYSLSGLLNQGVPERYYWRVRAFDRFGFILWAERIFTFEVSAYLAGDANSDQSVDAADIISLLNFLFRSGTPPYPLEAGDANCDEEVGPADVVYLINYLFRGGSEPCYP